MMKTRLVLVVAGLLLALVAVAHAGQTTYDDRAAWEAAVFAWSDVDLTPYTEYSTTTEVGLPALAAPATKITFDRELTALQVGSGWATWSGGNTPRVLWTGYQVSSLTGTFDAPLLGFGLELEPTYFGVFDMTLALASGETLMQSVDGDGGAKFFGFWGDTAITSWTVSMDEPDPGFAMGRMVVGAEGGDPPATPELSTWALLGCSGVIGLALRRRRKA